MDEQGQLTPQQQQCLWPHGRLLEQGQAAELERGKGSGSCTSKLQLAAAKQPAELSLGSAIPELSLSSAIPELSLSSPSAISQPSLSYPSMIPQPSLPAAQAPAEGWWRCLEARTSSPFPDHSA